MPGTITVRGRGRASAKPDDAEVTFVLSAVLPTAEQALNDVAMRSVRLKNLFDVARVPENNRQTTGVRVREEREWTKEKYVHRGYRAGTSVSIVVDDPDVIGRLMTLAVNDADAVVQGPEWRVALDNPAHTAARKSAIADARRHADAYADALGVRVGALVDVSEPGLQRRQQVHLMTMRTFDAAEEAPDVEIEAGETDIECAIDVVYAIEQ